MPIDYKNFVEYAKKDTPQVFFDYYYRLISYPVSYFLAKINITPNQIAFSQTIMYLFGMILIFLNFLYYGIIFFMISYLLDFCDGNVARVAIKIKGLDEEKRRKGILLENLNTNISIFTLYLSLGFYFSHIFNNIYFLFFGFSVFAMKMITRYTAHHASSIFSDWTTETPKQNVNAIYRESYYNRLKFLIRKSIFSANFYYVIYLISFLLLGKSTYLIFLIYGISDFLANFMRLLVIFFRRYKVKN